MKANLHKAHNFTNTIPFLNGFCAINVNGLFEKHFKEIYPEKLKLKKENISNTKASFLDIYLFKKHNKISTKLYDIRYSLPFDIEIYPQK